MNAKKTKRFAIVVSVMLAVSMVVSGITVFANTGVSSTKEQTEQQATELSSTPEEEPSKEIPEEPSKEAPEEPTKEAPEEPSKEIPEEPTKETLEETKEPEKQGEEVVATPQKEEAVLGESSKTAIVTIVQPAFAAELGGVVSVVRKDDGTAIATGDKVAVGTEVTLGVSGLPEDTRVVIMANDEGFSNGGAIPFSVNYTVEKDLTVTAEINRVASAAGDQTFTVKCNNTNLHTSASDHRWVVTRTGTDLTASNTNVIFNRDGTVFVSLVDCLDTAHPLPASAPTLVPPTTVTAEIALDPLPASKFASSMAGVTITGGFFDYSNRIANITSPIIVKGGELKNSDAGSLSLQVHGHSFTLEGGTNKANISNPSEIKISGGTNEADISAYTISDVSITGGQNTAAGIISGKEINITGPWSGGKVMGSTLTVGTGGIVSTPKPTTHINGSYGTTTIQVSGDVTLSGTGVIGTQGLYTVPSGANQGTYHNTDKVMITHTGTVPADNKFIITGGRVAPMADITVTGSILLRGGSVERQTSPTENHAVIRTSFSDYSSPTITTGIELGGSAVAGQVLITGDKGNIDVKSGSVLEHGLLQTKSGDLTLTGGTVSGTVQATVAGDISFPTGSTASVGGTVTTKSGKIDFVAGTITSGGTVQTLNGTGELKGGTVDWKGRFDVRGDATFTSGTMNGVMSSNQNVIVGGTSADGETRKAEKGTFSALSGKVTVNHASTVIRRVEGKDVEITKDHTLGIDSISSQGPLTLNATKGLYREVLAGGQLSPSKMTYPADGSVTVEIGMLYAGSDQVDITIPDIGTTPSPGFLVDGWKIGAISFGGKGKDINNGFKADLKNLTVGSVTAVNMKVEIYQTLESPISVISTSEDALTNGDYHGNVYLGGKGVVMTPSHPTIGETSDTKGTVTFPLDGTDVKIKGNLYGGIIAGSGTVGKSLITVTGATAMIEGAGGIFGGGLAGSVGTSDITITGADPLKDSSAAVYGGGNGGAITTLAHVKINTTTMDNNVFGGGYSTGSTVGSTKVDIGVTAKGTVTGSVYGGGTGSGANVSGNVVVTLGDGTTTNVGTVTGNVYGGGQSADVNVTATTTTRVTVSSGSTVGANVFGGGDGGSAKNTIVTISGTAGSSATNAVYGGGHSGSVDNTTVTITGKVTGSVYGGGRNNGATANSTLILAKGFIVGDVFGGGTGSGATVTGETNHTTPPVGKQGTLVLAKGFIVGDVYGGGDSADVTRSAYVDFAAAKSAADIFNGSVFGGGKSGTVGGNTVVLIGTPIAKGTDNHVYGGGNGGDVTGTTTVTVGAFTIASNIYGGGHDSATGATTVTINGSNISAADGNIFGGGRGQTKAADVNGTSTVNFEAGSKLLGNIYGGSDTKGEVTGKATVTVNAALVDGNTVYGGGKGLGTTTQSTDVYINKNVFENVYGGGEAGPVSGEAKITIAGTAIVGVQKTGEYRHVFGGAKGASAGSTTVLVAGTVNGHVYGSGELDGSPTAVIETNTKVTVTGKVIKAVTLGQSGNPQAQAAGNVYGGGDMPVGGKTEVIIGTAGGGVGDTLAEYIIGGGSGSSVVGSTEITVNSGTVNKEVYGGSANTGSTLSHVGSTTVNIKGGALNGNVHGGGFANGAGMPTTHVKTTSEVNVSGGTFATNVNVYGGGNGGAVVGLATVTLNNSQAHEFLGTNTIFGGGTDNFGNPTPTGSTKVDIKSTHGTAYPLTVFGGGENSLVHKTTVVDISNGTIGENVYGGGFNGAVNGTGVASTDNTIAVTIGTLGSATINQHLYGGGFESNASSNTPVTGNISLTVGTGSTITGLSPSVGTVFGGGRNNQTTGNVKVDFSGIITVGSLFGGGDNGNPATNATGFTDAVVGGNVTMTVGGTTTSIEDSVYGGGYKSGANVGASTKISFSGKYVVGTANSTVVGKNNVYGGGYNSNVAHATTIDIAGGTNAAIIGNVYGGGYGVGAGAAVGDYLAHDLSLNPAKDPVSAITIACDAPQNNVFGGGFDKTETLGSTKISVGGDGSVANTIYGGGEKNSTVNGNTFIELAGKTDAIFGGGWNNSPVKAHVASSIDGNTNIEITGTVGITPLSLYPGDVYGGGNNNSPISGSTDIKVDGTVGRDVYGGGITGLDIGASPSTVGKNTTITVLGTVVRDIYGGGQASSHVGGNTNITIDKDAIGTGAVGRDIFGGGHVTSEVKGSTGTTILIKGTVGRDIFGGGIIDSKVIGSTDISVIGGKVGQHIYGGGTSGVNKTTATPGTGSLVGGSTNIKITDHSEIGFDHAGITSPELGNVYGGGIDGSDVTGNATILVDKSQVKQDIFGGGMDISQIAGAVGTKITVQNGSEIGQDIFGGGINDSEVVGNTVITITGAGTKVGQDVFGGGTSGLDKLPAPAANVASLTRRTSTVELSAGAVVGRDIFGGGLGGSNVYGDATVTVTGTGTKVGQDVFGGGTSGVRTAASAVAGNGSNIGGDTFVTVSDQASVGAGIHRIGNVYGGGYDNSQVAKNSNVKVISKAQVAQDVFGGGMLNSNIYGTIGATVLIDGTIERDVFGGGIHNSDIPNGGTYVTIEKESGIVEQDVFGGGIDGSDIEKNADVLIRGEVIGNVYGAGTKAGTDPAKAGTVGTPGTVGSVVGENTHVTVTGHVGKTVHGGGHDDSPVNGYATVQIEGDDTTRNTVGINVFGGGTINSPIKSVNSVNDGTTVTITGKSITGTSIIGNDVYGGGLKGSSLTDNRASAKVLVDTFAIVKGSVYGGGKEGSTIAKATLVDIKGTVSAPLTTRSPNTTNNVFGAGWNDSSINELNTQGGAVVNIYGTARISGNVFGGGRQRSHVKGLDGTRVEVMDGAIIGIGARTSEVFVFSPIEAGYKSFPTYQIVNEIYPHNGNVYGGGSAGGTLAASRADASNVSAATGKGSYVHIAAGAKASGVIYGGGFASDIIGNNGGATVLMEGQVTAVHGGGRQGSVGNNTRDGAIVTITGSKALVYHDVYGGGYAETLGSNTEVRKTDVLIDKQANVRERVFGGGHKLGAGINETTKVDINGIGTFIGHKEMLDGTNYSALINAVTGISGNEIKRAIEHDKFFEFYNRYTAINRTTGKIPISDKDSFNALGQVYGGGNDAGVVGNITIDIDNNERNTGQKVFDRISGGNLGAGMLSGAGQLRTINMKNFGKGDCTTEFTNADTPYSKLENFAAVRFLQDYTEANIDHSYLTIYYNLKSYDDGSSLLGGKYTTDYTSLYNQNRGIYHPWRPEPDTNVRIEPEVNIINQAKLRVRSGYTISLDNGIFIIAPGPTTVSLWIDLASDEYVATTTKIYSEIPNNVKQTSVFRYGELPRTLFPKNIIYLANKDIHGVNFYIPPRRIKPSTGDPTVGGGTGIVDRGTGSSSGGGFGGGFGGGGGGGAALKATPAIGGAEYLTVETQLVKQDSIAQRVTEAIKNASTNQTGYVTEKLAGQIAGDTLRTMISTAKTAGRKVMYHADTVRKPSFVEGRMYIDPAKAASVKGVISTGIYTHQSKIALSNALFSKFFKNNLAIVHLAQEGDFGMSVEIAAKVDLKELNLDSLRFYTYNIKTNAYSQLASPNYFVDKNGYLHFTTTTGGEIIITDSELVRK